MNHEILYRVAGVALGTAASAIVITAVVEGTHDGIVSTAQAAVATGAVGAAGSFGVFGVKAGIDRHEETVRARRHRRAAGTMARRPDTVAADPYPIALLTTEDVVEHPAPDTVEEALAAGWTHEPVDDEAAAKRAALAALPAAAQIRLQLNEPTDEDLEQLAAKWGRWTASGALPAAARTGLLPTIPETEPGRVDPYLASAAPATYDDGWEHLGTISADDLPAGADLYARPWTPAVS